MYVRIFPARSPWDLFRTRFAGFLPLNYVICICAACVRNIFAMWDDWASLQHGSRLTLGWYFAPHWPLYQKIYAQALPLRKSCVRPYFLPNIICIVWRQRDANCQHARTRWVPWRHSPFLLWSVNFVQIWKIINFFSMCILCLVIYNHAPMLG